MKTRKKEREREWMNERAKNEQQRKCETTVVFFAHRKLKARLIASTARILLPTKKRRPTILMKHILKMFKLDLHTAESLPLSHKQMSNSIEYSRSIHLQTPIHTDTHKQTRSHCNLYERNAKIPLLVLCERYDMIKRSHEPSSDYRRQTILPKRR